MPNATPIAGAPTSIAAFLGVAQKGASYHARQVSSLAEFVTRFGALRSDMELGYAISQFFTNGGKTAWVVRVARKASLAQWQRGLNALDLVAAVNLLALPGVEAAEFITLQFCFSRQG